MRHLFYFDDKRFSEAEQALEEIEGRMLLELDAHRYGVIIFHPDGKVLSVNHQWQRLYELDLETIKDYNILEDENLKKKHIWDPIQGAFLGNAGVVEANYFSPAEWGKNGRSRWTEGHCLPLNVKVDKSEKLLGVVLILKDITELKRSLYEAERLRMQVSEMYARQEELFRGFSSYRERLLAASSARPKTMPDAQQLRRKAASIPKREQEVFDLLAAGCTVKETAHVLDLAIKSVYTYRTRLMERLHICGSVELAVAWRELQEPSGDG